MISRPKLPILLGFFQVKTYAWILNDELNFVLRGGQCHRELLAHAVRFTALCKASCAIRNRHSEMSFGRCFGTFFSAELMATSCCLENSPQ